MIKSSFAIYGASGFGREVFCYLRENQARINQSWDFIGFFDDGTPINTGYLKYGSILGGIEILNNWSEELNVIIAISNPEIRSFIYSKIINDKIKFPNLINSDVIIFDKDINHFGKGNIIFSKCNFSVDTYVGDFNIFNGSISVGHDSMIGSYNSFMPGSKVSGMVKIGNGNQFGMNSTMIQGISIGNKNVIAPNTFLTKSIGDQGTYYSAILKKL
jgi:sugar O-acyltransferase (sialic acid O-acetyltransferase NeuD family)